MIGCSTLGNNGRLGNQMFQYASLRGIAANNNLDWCIPAEDIVHKDNYGLFETFKLSNVKQKNINSNFVASRFSENKSSFIDDLFDKCLDNIDLYGYFQTEKYFQNISEEVREDFTFKDEYLIPCKEYINSLHKPPIFLHIRRTDAVGREEYHPVLSLLYYEKALSNFDNNTPCFVFSDDLEWCKSQKFFDQDRFLFNESNQRYSYKTIDGTGKLQNTLLPQVDLCLMSLCSGAIIANSTFSWWGAWLQNDRGKVIAPNPQKWYGPSLNHLDTSDIIPERWITQDY